MRVRFYNGPHTDLFSDAPQPQQIHGTLTTDHARSSYGLPVVVADDGQVYGPGDIPSGDRTIIDDLGAGHLHIGLVVSARAAGYVVDSPTCPIAEPAT